MPEKSDRALIVECLRGSQSAFEAMFDRYERKVFFIALQMVGNREDALDVSQMAFASAFSNLRGFDTRRPLAPWLFRIVRNRSVDLLRKKKGRVSHDTEQTEQLPSPVDDPSALVQRDEIKQKIWSAMERLAVHEREVLVLREFHDMSYKEIASVLDVPMGTVMSRLSAARKKLRGLLEDYVS